MGIFLPYWNKKSRLFVPATSSSNFFSKHCVTSRLFVPATFCSNKVVRRIWINQRKSKQISFNQTHGDQGFFGKMQIRAERWDFICKCKFKMVFRKSLRIQTTEQKSL